MQVFYFKNIIQLVFAKKNFKYVTVKTPNYIIMYIIYHANYSKRNSADFWVHLHSYYNRLRYLGLNLLEQYRTTISLH